MYMKMCSYFDKLIIESLSLITFFGCFVVCRFGVQGVQRKIRINSDDTAE